MSDARDAQNLPDDEADKPSDRKRDLLGRKNSVLRRKLVETWDQVKKGFDDQSERSDAQMDYWDAYNCVLNANQFYNGDAQIYVPIVRDAINARATRFVNQLFPQGGRYVEAVSSDGSTPHAIVALIDHYIRQGKLKTQIFKPMIRNGDIEGQYNLYVDWSELEREIATKKMHGPQVEVAGEAIDVPGEDIDDIETELVIDGRPVCEVLHDSDVLILPASADNIEEAFAAGGLVAIVRRWSKAKIDAMMSAGHINKDDGKSLLDHMSGVANGTQNQPQDAEKALAEHAGIKKKGSEAVVWEVWKNLPLNDNGAYSDSQGEPRLCRMFFGPDQTALGCVRNPNWNDRCNLLTAPGEKVSGVAKGKSQVEPIISIQYEANDAANEMADCDHYAALPIIMRNPEGGNQTPLVLNIAAVWDVDPNKIKFAEFPDLGQRGVRRIQLATQQIFQSLGVNPSMLPQQTSSAKPSQAKIAQEQAVDLLTTAEAVSVIEEGIATPLMAWFVDLDYQHRDRDVAVRAFGEMGVKAAMQEVPPQQNRTHHEFRWWGVEQARNAAQMQQQIAWLNVARGMEPMLQKQGYELNVAPALEASAMAVFGSRLAPLILKDIRANLSMDPNIENQLLTDGFDAPVHPLDDDQAHVKAHQQALMLGDPTGMVRAHVQAHMAQMRMKQMAMMQQAMQQQMAGRGEGARPSRGGGMPRIGAQPAGPKAAQSPPGSIHPDQMPRAGGMQMPRKL